MNKFSLQLFCIALLICSACNTSAPAQEKQDPTSTLINKASWLIGTWKNAKSKSNIYETWTMTDDLEFTGKSYLIKDGDTSFLEMISLVQDEDVLYYIPAPKNQNDGQPVPFKSTLVDENKMIFENPKHDFPQIISYQKINPDSLVAEISGTKDGQQEARTFPMRKINLPH